MEHIFRDIIRVHSSYIPHIRSNIFNFWLFFTKFRRKICKFYRFWEWCA